MSNTAAAPQAPRLSDSLGASALVVLLGVAFAWYQVTNEPRSVEAGPGLAQLATPSAVVEAAASLADRGDSAYAAGRILEPPGDNALEYYREALVEVPGNTAARDGLARVASYTLGRAERALDEGRLREARADAQRVQDLDPAAASLLTRIESTDRLQRLGREAANHLAAGRLLAPDGRNARASYNAMLRLDPNNRTARRGLTRIGQQLFARAQSAEQAGRWAEADRLLAAAGRLAPDLQGAEQLARTLAERRAQTSDGSLDEALAAANAALQDGRLLQPEGNNALAGFQQVLAVVPDHPQALSGIQRVQEALVAKARTAILADNLDEATSTLLQARAAGVTDKALGELGAEYRHRQYLRDFAEGDYGTVYDEDDLEVLRRVTPELPQVARWGQRDGWVDLTFTVDVDGRARAIMVDGSSAAVFETPAVDTLERWQFAPVQQDGRAIPVRAELRLEFADN